MTAVFQLTFKGVNEEVLDTGAVALSSSSELWNLPSQLARTSVLSVILLTPGQPNTEGLKQWRKQMLPFQCYLKWLIFTLFKSSFMNQGLSSLQFVHAGELWNMFILHCG